MLVSTPQSYRIDWSRDLDLLNEDLIRSAPVGHPGQSSSATSVFLKLP